MLSETNKTSTHYSDGVNHNYWLKLGTCIVSNQFLPILHLSSFCKFYVPILGTYLISVDTHFSKKLTHGSLNHKLILLDTRICKHESNHYVHRRRKHKSYDNFQDPLYNRFLFLRKERIQFRHPDELDGSYPFLPVE